jgi:stress-induced morphogen
MLRVIPQNSMGMRKVLSPLVMGSSCSVGLTDPISSAILCRSPSEVIDMLAPDALKQRIEDELSDVHVEVMDMTGEMDHFRVIVISPEFEGLPMVKQHQLVYDALGDAMDGDIHALGLKTYTPEEWETIRNSQST